MRHQWGRSNGAGRQRSRWPVYTLLLLPWLVLTAGIGTAAYRYQTFTTLQRWYLTSYIKSSYVLRVGSGAIGRLVAKDARLSSALAYGNYQLVDLVDDRYIASQPAQYAHADIEPWLRETVYDGETVGQFLAWWPVATSASALLVGLCFTITLDARRRRRMREGEVLRGGPRERTVAEFNRAHLKNNGIRILVDR